MMLVACGLSFVLVFFIVVLSILQTFFSVSIADFEQVNVSGINGYVCFKMSGILSSTCCLKG